MIERIGYGQIMAAESEANLEASKMRRQYLEYWGWVMTDNIPCLGPIYERQIEDGRTVLLSEGSATRYTQARLDNK